MARLGPRRREPDVGALVLKNGALIGEGWHAEFGGPHAETLALKAAGAEAKGADLVVTLEPCAHRGKTPPCAEAIVDAGIRRVVFGAADVDPRAKGGAGVLRRAGIAVEGGLLADEVRAQNAAFFHQHAPADRPMVAIKLAVSLDGRIADHERRSQWIAGAESRGWVHWLRAGFDAIGVGVGTVRSDDPRLTVRGEVTPLVAPLRVVFDDRAKTPVDARILRDGIASVAILTAPDAPQARLEKLRDREADVITADGLSGQLRALKARGITSLLVEGGGILAGRLVQEGLVDRLFILTAPIMLGHDGVPAFGALSGVKLADVHRWRLVGRKSLGADTLIVLDR